VATKREEPSFRTKEEKSSVHTGGKGQSGHQTTSRNLGENWGGPDKGSGKPDESLAKRKGPKAPSRASLNQLRVGGGLLGVLYKRMFHCKKEGWEGHQDLIAKRNIDGARGINARVWGVSTRLRGW